MSEQCTCRRVPFRMCGGEDGIIDVWAVTTDKDCPVHGQEKADAATGDDDPEQETGQPKFWFEYFDPYQSYSRGPDIGIE